MADIFVPSNVSSITFTTSGVKAVSGGKITGITALEASGILGSDNMGKNQGSEWQGFRLENANLATGNCSFLAPPVITSITMSATPFAVVGGRITAVPAADATILATQGFDLITG
jgi:hypothetical protein